MAEQALAKPGTVGHGSKPNSRIVGTAGMSARGDNPREQLQKLPPPRRTLLHRLTAWADRAQALRSGVHKARERSTTLDAAFETIERDSEIGGGMLNPGLTTPCRAAANRSPR